MTYRLKAGKPSLTAEIQAGLRHASTSESLQLRGNDRLAKYFLTGINNLFRIPLARRLAIARVEKLWPGGYGYSLARSRVGDTVFRDSVLQVQQIVNVGAGYCTRPIRYKSLLEENDVKVIEVDHPATQKRKLEVTSSFALPNGLEFIECDFEKNTLKEILEPRLNSAKATLFIWEGVSMYLQLNEVEDAIQFFSSFPNCKLLFDTCSAIYIESHGVTGDPLGGKRLFETCESKGEPLRFGIDSVNLKSWLNSRSFETEALWTSDRVEQEYLSDCNGKLIRPCSPPMTIALAKRMDN